MARQNRQRRVLTHNSDNNEDLTEEQKMKRLISTLAIAMLWLAIGSTTAFSQKAYPPNSTNLYFTYSTASAKAYTASQLDTLPSPEATVPYLRIAGSPILSVTTTLTDTGNVILHFQTRTRGLTSWTALDVAAGDTITYEGTTTHKTEIVLRSATADRLGCYDCEFRIINAWEATGQAKNSGAPTDHPKYTQAINYKP
jgi:hypothetical protein